MAGNAFGKLFTVTSFGESHGPAIGCVVDGVPPLIDLGEADIQGFVDKRRPGQSKFTSQRQESDTVQILSGVFEGKTTGAPIGLMIVNEDQRSKDYDDIKDTFRPGHADYTYFKKYGIRDYRGGGRSSARETAMRVAAGAIARKVLGNGVHVRGALVQMGGHEINRDNWEPRQCGLRQLGLGRNRQQPLLVPRRQGGRRMGRLPGRHPQGRIVHRCGDRNCRQRFARRIG